MKENWILKEARRQKDNKDTIILENPKIRKHVDNLLLKSFWPVIRKELVDSMYNFWPFDKPETEFERQRSLSRSLRFMLLDGDTAFFRGKLTCSAEDWMLDSEFFLSLPIDTDPRIIYEILGNSRLSGNPPMLSIDKRYETLEITFQSGKGAGWGLYGEDHVKDKIREAFDTNIDMHILAMDEGLTADNLGEFLTMVYKVYEAY